MSLSETEPLSPQSAAGLARSWIDNRLGKSPRAYMRSQMRRLMDQLAERCITETVRLNENEEGLYEQLDIAYNVIQSTWYSVAPAYTTDFTTPVDFSDDERQKIERARGTVWVRHDPKRAFDEGFHSENYIAVRRESFENAVTEYLRSSYLRHPEFDWILLDISITREICEFGEAIKKYLMPRKRESWFGVDERYLKSQGNLSKMMKIAAGEYLKRLATKFLSILIFLIASTWAAFQAGYGALGWGLAGIYLLLLVGLIGASLARAIARRARQLAGNVDIHAKPFALWGQMYRGLGTP